jgi:hypothetical protein
VEEEHMGRRARHVEFDSEHEAAKVPAAVEAGERRGRRHGRGLGLRPSRYVGRHRVVEETNGHRPDRAELPERPARAEARKAKKANDFGFGS